MNTSSAKQKGWSRSQLGRKRERENYDQIERRISKNAADAKAQEDSDRLNSDAAKTWLKRGE
jgi:ribose 1,5-bisphosphokinase PhnN